MMIGKGNSLGATIGNGVACGKVRKFLPQRLSYSCSVPFGKAGPMLLYVLIFKGKPGTWIFM